MRSMWMLPLAFALAACGGGSDDDGVDAILALDGDPVAGEAVYASTCAACHGADGEGGSGPAMAGIVADESDADIVEVVLDGEGSMPPQDLTDQEVADVLAYLIETF